MSEQNQTTENLDELECIALMEDGSDEEVMHAVLGKVDIEELGHTYVVLTPIQSNGDIFYDDAFIMRYMESGNDEVTLEDIDNEEEFNKAAEVCGQFIPDPEDE